MKTRNSNQNAEAPASRPGKREGRLFSPAFTVVLSGAILLMVLAFIVVFQQRARVAYEHDAQNDVGSITRMKVDQINAWRRERLADAGVIAQSDVFATLVGSMNRNPVDPALLRSFTAFMDLFRKSYGYEDVLLINPQNSLALDLFPAHDTMAQLLLGNEALREALNRDSPSLIDMLDETLSERFHVLLVIPAAMAPSGKEMKGAGVILTVHTSEHLFPLVNSWPVPSETAEPVLAQQVGDEVVVMNDMRSRPGATSFLRIPLTRTDLPLVQAVKGREGLFSANDYRGVPCIGDIRRIPNSPWFLGSKIDRSEAYADWNRMSQVLYGLMALLLILILGTIWIYVNQMEKERLRRLYQAEVRLRKAEIQFGTIFRSIGDGVIVTDASGRVRMLNTVAEGLTGFSSENAQGRNFMDVFHVIEEKTRARIPDPVEQVLREGARMELEHLGVMIPREGAEFPVSVSASPIRDETNATSGVVVVLRDRTQQRESEKSIARSMALLNEAQGIAHLGSFESDRVKGTASWSDELCRIMGVDPRQAISGTRESFWNEVIHPEDRLRVRTEHEQALARRQTAVIRFRILLPDGGFKHVEMRANADYAPDGSVLRTRGSIQDISRSVEQEAAVRASEARWRSIFRASPDFFAILAPDGQFRDVSRVGLGLMGFASMEDARPRSLMEFLDVPDQLRLQTKFERVGKGEVLKPAEYMLVRPDGSRVPVEISCEVLKDETGQLSEVLVDLRDISDRKRYEDQLVRERTRLETLIETSRAGTWEWDIPSGLLDINDRYAAILGYSKDEMCPLQIAKMNEIFHPDDAAQFRANVEGCLSGKRDHFQHEHRQRHKDGHWVWLLSVGRLVARDLDGKPRLMMGMITDISERKKAEEERLEIQEDLMQAQKMESIVRMAGGVAHDFNNQLQAIIGFTELMLEDMSPDRPEFKDLMKIRKSAGLASDLTHKLLALSRRQVIHPVSMDLNRTIAEMLHVMQPFVGARLALSWTPDPSLYAVRMDPAQLQQIVLGLCTFSKDTITGTGAISLETRHVTLDESFCKDQGGRLASGSYARLAFRDTGPALSSDALQHAFEPYYTSGKGDRKISLGLAAVQGAVIQNGGMICVHNDADGGREFHVYLPLCNEDPEYPPLAAPQGVAPAELPRGRGELVLLVDDEPTIIEVGQRMLTDLGYRVVSMTDPWRALEWVEQESNHADLLLTDVVMADMGGDELARRICAADPGMKCIYMSGYTANELGENMELAADIPLILKPFSRETLAESVHRALA